MSTGVPKVGILQNAAWNLSDMCRFKLLPPPQPDRSVSDKDKRELQVQNPIYFYNIIFLRRLYYNNVSFLFIESVAANGFICKGFFVEQ